LAHWTRTLIAALAALAAFGQEAKPPKSAFDKPTLEAYLRHLNLWKPEVRVEIEDPAPSAMMPGFKDVKVRASLGERSITATYLVSADGRKILQANVYDIEWNPFREDLAKLDTKDSPSLGTPGATAVLVLFSDFQCSYCREEALMLRQHLIQNYPTQVRLYFKDFPLEAIHPWARAAAEAGRCVFRAQPKKFWDFHDWIFDQQAEITPENLKAKAMEWAAAQGLDTLQLSQCIDTRATAPQVQASIDLAKELRVGSTPTLFLNGRRIPGRTEWGQLKELIDIELDYQKTAKNAGEDCGCDLTLPPAPGAPSLPGGKLTPETKP
jgi:protein-disulfide isomerase